ncbi:MAG: hypothetical protein GWN37_12400 [Gammaproteobacteria bacterium]|nr:hypothetical protein [Gammaproteobacteria bacterium]
MRVREVLAELGFAPLPRRLDEERPDVPRPSVEAVADARAFSLTPRRFHTRCGGLFLFVPELVRLELEQTAEAARLRGSKMIPRAHALRACLALKLWAIERKSHVMALVADEGLGLFCGLNRIPKKSYLCEYSSRITAKRTTALLAAWHATLLGDEALFPARSFDLDFHSVPYHGEHPSIERHYVSKRSRRQPSVLVFLAQDADAHAFCYADANLRKGEEPEAVFGFLEFWQRTHGALPAHAVFDSRLTTYAGLARLDEMGVTFITLRRRSPKILAEIRELAPSAWRRVTLVGPTRKYRTPPGVGEEGEARRTLLPTTLRPRARARGAYGAPDQRDAHTGQAHHPLRPAHAHRERHLRCGALLPHGCAVLERRSEGRLRHGAARHRQWSLPPPRPTHARLRR